MILWEVVVSRPAQIVGRLCMMRVLSIQHLTLATLQFMKNDTMHVVPVSHSYSICVVRTLIVHAITH